MESKPVILLKVCNSPVVWRILRHCIQTENVGPLPRPDRNTSTLNHHIFPIKQQTLAINATVLQPSECHVQQLTLVSGITSRFFTLQTFTPSFTCALSDKLIIRNAEPEYWLKACSFDCRMKVKLPSYDTKQFS